MHRLSQNSLCDQLAQGARDRIEVVAVANRQLPITADGMGDQRLGVAVAKRERLFRLLVLAQSKTSGMR